MVAGCQSFPVPCSFPEILFIEQCHLFLAEGGYLAIVIPDGILTNSSLQYVRDEIEDLYRIVAVVSLPQTTFTATGRPTRTNELEPIATELARFIHAVEEGEA